MADIDANAANLHLIAFTVSNLICFYILSVITNDCIALRYDLTRVNKIAIQGTH